MIYAKVVSIRKKWREKYPRIGVDLCDDMGKELGKASTEREKNLDFSEAFKGNIFFLSNRRRRDQRRLIVPGVAGR